MRTLSGVWSHKRCAKTLKMTHLATDLVPTPGGQYPCHWLSGGVRLGTTPTLAYSLPHSLVLTNTDERLTMVGGPTILCLRLTNRASHCAPQGPPSSPNTWGKAPVPLSMILVMLQSKRIYRSVTIDMEELSKIRSVTMRLLGARSGETQRPRVVVVGARSGHTTQGTTTLVVIAFMTHQGNTR